MHVSIIVHVGVTGISKEIGKESIYHPAGSSNHKDTIGSPRLLCFRTYLPPCTCLAVVQRSIAKSQFKKLQCSNFAFAVITPSI